VANRDPARDLDSVAAVVVSMFHRLEYFEAELKIIIFEYIFVLRQGILKGKYHCTADFLFDWFGISCMTTDSFCF